METDKAKVSPNTARDEHKIFSDLELLCSSPGYIHAIAYFCWRDNIIPFDGTKVTDDDIRYQYSHDKLVRTEISTLIGLLVKQKIEWAIPKPNVLQTLIDRTEELLYEFHMCLQKPWIEGFRLAEKNPGKAQLAEPFSSADGLREPIFYGGESAYNFQYQSLAQLKYQRDNEWLKANKGFTIDEACQLFKVLGDFQIQRLIDFREPMVELPPDQWTFLPGFRFTADELVKPSGLVVKKIELILNSFCLGEDCNNQKFNGFSDFNESNASPIIKSDDNSFVLLQHYSLLEALYETPFYWMGDDKNYYPTAAKNRGIFAEVFLHKRLSSVFGEKHVLKNIDIYKGKSRIAEADVLVLYGNRTLVVQAKSKKLTIEARKGNDLQLKDDFKKAIQDAYDQSVLCSKALIDEACTFIDADGNEINLEKNLKAIFPICIVSEHYPALAAQTRQFLKAHSKKPLRSAIITDVFFMDVLAEILESPLQFINYLELRSKFDAKLLVSQELINLSYHLKHNLWLEEKYDMVNLGDDFSSSLDIAMMARRNDVPGEKNPQGILTRFDGTAIGRLLKQIEKAETPELVGLGLLFLQLSSQAAKHINNGIDHLAKSALQDGKHHDFSVPFELENSGFTVHINDLPTADAQDRIYAHCRMRKYDTKSDSWYGLLLAPGSGEIKKALVIEGEWIQEKDMEELAEKWPRKPMLKLSSLSSKRRKKIGRNDRCPCGSGKKYKKCCLNNLYQN